MGRQKCEKKASSINVKLTPKLLDESTPRDYSLDSNFQTDKPLKKA